MNRPYHHYSVFDHYIISSVNDNEGEILQDILYLHNPSSEPDNNIDLDPTYSIGNFYNGKGIKKPKYKFDLYPQLAEVKKANSNNIPLENESCNIIIFDPPFLIGGKDKLDVVEGSNLMQRRFETFTSFKELQSMYVSSLKEFYRLLKPKGIVIFKCQDVICSGTQNWTHVYLMNWAKRIGYYPKDLFIYVNKNRLTDKRKQHHARKYHCYYWVFQKIN